MIKVKLIRNTRVAYQAGETIEVTPELYEILVATGSAEPITEKKEPVKKTVKKK